MHGRHCLSLCLALSLMACGEDTPKGEGVFSPRAPNEEAPAAADPEEPAPRPAEPESPGAPQAVLPEGRRESLKRLAIASECMRRAALPAETVMTRMLALYEEEAIELATYTREMGRLASDRAFQAEIQAGLEACPPVAVKEAPADDTQLVDAPPDGDDEEGLPPDGLAEEAAPAQGEDTSPSAEDDAADGHIPAEEALEPLDDEEDAEDTGPDYSGTWTGAFRGSISGTARIVVSGRRVTSATMVWRGRTVRLRGSLGRNGQLTLGGRINASDFMNVRGRIDRSAKRLTGTWSGVVDRKRVQGNLTLTR